MEMAAAVAITRRDASADELRRTAARMRDGALVRRLLALAMVMEGTSRREAAEACGMDRQTLRDWVHRYNDGGIPALADQPHRGRPPRLSAEQMAELKALVLTGPEPERDCVVRWRCIDLRGEIARRFSVELHERS